MFNGISMETKMEQDYKLGLSLDERKLLSQLFRDMGTEERGAPQLDLHNPPQHRPSRSSCFICEDML